MFYELDICTKKFKLRHDLSGFRIEPNNMNC